MKRRDQGISNAWSFLLGFVILTVVVPGVLIGPARAVRLIGSAVSSTVMQSAAPDAIVPNEHSFPTVEIASENELITNDVHFPITLEALGDDRSLIQFDSTSVTPFGPFEKILITEPSADLLGGDLALWIAGRMGVPIPFHQPINLRRDGNDAGIHELSEYVGDKFEQYRGITDGSVAVLRVKDDVEERTDPWTDPQLWDTSEADEGSIEQFQSLIGLLKDTLIATADRRTQLEVMIDVEAFNRYHAATLMVGASSEEPASFVLVQNPRTSQFYPVLIDAPLIPATDGTIPSEAGDLLSQRMMSISDWRKQRDGFVSEALATIHKNGSFNDRLTRLSAMVQPSVKNVSSSRRPLFSMQASAAAGAGLDWSADRIRERVAEHWNKLSPVVSTEATTVDVMEP